MSNSKRDTDSRPLLQQIQRDQASPAGTGSDIYSGKQNGSNLSALSRLQAQRLHRAERRITSATDGTHAALCPASKHAEPSAIAYECSSAPYCELQKDWQQNRAQCRDQSATSQARHVPRVTTTAVTGLQARPPSRACNVNTSLEDAAIGAAIIASVGKQESSTCVCATAVEAQSSAPSWKDTRSSCAEHVQPCLMHQQAMHVQQQSQLLNGGPGQPAAALSMLSIAGTALVRQQPSAQMMQQQQGRQKGPAETSNMYTSRVRASQSHSSCFRTLGCGASWVGLQRSAKVLLKPSLLCRKQERTQHRLVVGLLSPIITD